MSKNLDKHENSENVNDDHENPMSIWDKIIANWKYIFALVILYIGFYYLIKGKELSELTAQLITVIFIPILVSLMLIIVERLFEKRAIYSMIKSDIEKLRFDIKEDFETTITSTYKFGFDGVKNNIDDEAIITDRHNTDVKWMNTKFSEHNNVEKTVHIALLNGCNVKLLMMHKDNECAEFRAKDACSDHTNEENVKVMIEGYLSKLNTSYAQLLNFYTRMKKERDENNSMGNLELRFYKDLPSIPIIIVNKDNKAEEAWTGFYLTKYSSQNPYIKWIPKGDNFMMGVDEYFERKWYFASKWDAEIILGDKHNAQDNYKV